MSEIAPNGGMMGRVPNVAIDKATTSPQQAAANAQLWWEHYLTQADNALAMGDQALANEYILQAFAVFDPEVPGRVHAGELRLKVAPEDVERADGKLDRVGTVSNFVRRQAQEKGLTSGRRQPHGKNASRDSL